MSFIYGDQTNTYAKLSISEKTTYTSLYTIAFSPVINGEIVVCIKENIKYRR